MLNAAFASPAGPAKHDDAQASFASLSRRFRDPFAFRPSPVFAGLSASAWMLFTAIWHHLWGAERDAYPTQARLVALTGFCLRLVRTATRELEAANVLVTRRVKRSAGGYRNVYEPGPALVSALVDLHEKAALRAASRDAPPRVPKPKILRAKPCGTERRTHAAPDADDLCSSGISANPSSSRDGAEEPAARPVEEKRIEVSSTSRESAPAERAQTTPPEAPVAAEDRELARTALQALAKRKRPEAEPPAWFDATSIALVAARLAEMGGSREAKATAVTDALDGAFSVSRERPPTVKYVFGTTEFFLEHVRRGHEARARAERRRADEERKAARKAAAPAVPSPRPLRPSREELREIAEAAGALVAKLEAHAPPPVDAPSITPPSASLDEARTAVIAELEALSRVRPKLTGLLHDHHASRMAAMNASRPCGST